MELEAEATSVSGGLEDPPRVTLHVPRYSEQDAAALVVRWLAARGFSRAAGALSEELHARRGGSGALAAVQRLPDAAAADHTQLMLPQLHAQLHSGAAPASEARRDDDDADCRTEETGGEVGPPSQPQQQPPPPPPAGPPQPQKRAYEYGPTARRPSAPKLRRGEWREVPRL